MATTVQINVKFYQFTEELIVNNNGNANDRLSELISQGKCLLLEKTVTVNNIERIQALYSLSDLQTYIDKLRDKTTYPYFRCEVTFTPV